MNKLVDLPFMPNRHRICLAVGSLREWLRGLDFTMPDRMTDRGRGDGAMYYASPADILHRLFACVDTASFDSFIDVGCGKGYVMYEAAKYGFARVGGVEYDGKLVKTCRRNIRRLRLQQKVSVECVSACDFERYGDYSVFYFFNPFVGEVMEKVMAKIIEACRGREIMIIYYRPRYPEAIERCGYFEKQCELHDGEKDYMAYVYRGRIP